MKRIITKRIVFSVISLLIILATIGFFLRSTSAQPGAALDAMILTGKTQLFQRSISGALSAHQTFSTANASYDSATREQKINLRAYRALTRMIDVALRDDNTANADTLTKLLKQYGFYRTGDEFDNVRFSGPVNQNEKPVLPSTAPSADAIRTFLAGPFLTALDASIADMNDVIGLLGASETKEILSRSLIAPEDRFQRDVEIDDGDYYLFRSALKALKVYVLTLTAYDMNNLSIREIVAMVNMEVFDPNMLLTKYPNFMKVLATGGAASLASAKTVLKEAISDYLTASEKIRNDVDLAPGAEELFSIEPDMLTDELRTRTNLTTLKNSLDSDSGTQADLLSGSSDHVYLNLNPLFNGNIHLRNLLPQFSAYGSPIRGTVGYGLNGVPDANATLGGIMPGYTQDRWSREISDLQPAGMFDIPVVADGAIVVDGQTADWNTAGVTTPVFTDITGEQNINDPARDLHMVFLAKDTTYLYVRMDTEAAPTINPQSQYGYQLDFTGPNNNGESWGSSRIQAQLRDTQKWNFSVTDAAPSSPVKQLQMLLWNFYWGNPQGNYTYQGTCPDADFGCSQNMSWGTTQGTWVWTGTMNEYKDVSLTFNFTSGYVQFWGNYTNPGKTQITGNYSGWTNSPSFRSFSGVFTATRDTGYSPGWSTFLTHSGQASINLDENMAMGAGSTVEFKVPLAQLGDMRGRFLGANIYFFNRQWWNSYDNAREYNHTAIQIGTEASLAKVTGTLTVPGYDGTGSIYIGLFRDDGSYSTDPEKRIAGLVINPGQYYAGMNYEIKNLPVGVKVFVAVHWDRDLNGIVSPGDYTNFYAPFTTATAVTVTQNLTTPDDHPPYPAPQLFDAKVQSRRFAGGGPQIIFISTFVRGPSPEDVTVSVTHPNGATYDLSQMSFSQQWGRFYYSTPTYLPNGDYTFEAVDSLGRRDKVTYHYEYNAAVPFVEITTLTVNSAPVSGSPTAVRYLGNITTETTPLEFVWASPAGEGPFYYSARLQDMNGKVLYYATPGVNKVGISTSPSITVPAGTLQPNTWYQFYVRAYDRADQPMNHTQSNNLYFYTGAYAATPATAWTSGPPAWAQIYMQPPSGTSTLYRGYMEGHIPGVAPWELVTGRLKKGTATLISLSLPSASSYAGLRLWAAGYSGIGVSTQNQLLDGTDYTMEMDINRSGTITTIPSPSITFNYTTVQAVDIKTLVPGHNYYFNTATPTFSWGAVADANTYYRARIYDPAGNVDIWSSCWTKGTSVTVPSGKLQPGFSYQWTVQTSSDFVPQDVNNLCSGGTYHSINFVNMENNPGNKALLLFTINPTTAGLVKISGQITGDTGLPLAGVRVEAIASGDSVTSYMTGIGGAYELYVNPGGSYVIQVSADGYLIKKTAAETGSTNITENIAFTAADILPAITHITPAPGISVINRRPEISAVISPLPAYISAANIFFSVDGSIKTATFDAGSGRVSYTPTSDLSLTSHIVSVAVKDAENFRTLAQKSWSFNVTANAQHGDLSGDGWVDLADAVIALRIISGMPHVFPFNYPASGADVNNDNKVGLEEVIYILQYVAGLRQ